MFSRETMTACFGVIKMERKAGRVRGKDNGLDFATYVAPDPLQDPS